MMTTSKDHIHIDVFCCCKFIFHSVLYLFRIVFFFLLHVNKHAVYTDYHIQFVRVRTADFHVFSVILFTVGQDYSLNPQISIIASASTRRQRHA